MPEQSSSRQPDPKAHQLVKERIKELDGISEILPDILRSTATAISALTNQPIFEPLTNEERRKLHDSLELRQELLQNNTKAFSRLVRDMDEKLHKQVNLLEDANIIPSTLHPPGALGNARETDGSAAKKDPETVVINGGLGKLDIGYLNSQAKTTTEGMEPDLFERANKLLDDLAENTAAAKEIIHGKRLDRIKRFLGNDYSHRNDSMVVVPSYLLVEGQSVNSKIFHMTHKLATYRLLDTDRFKAGQVEAEVHRFLDEVKKMVRNAEV